MSKALTAWRQAWALSKFAQEPKARAIADYSVGELAEFEAYLGRVERLGPLLKEVRNRPMHGSGAENISNASQGLAEMRTHPEDAFRCGPMALYQICLLQGRTAGAARLEDVHSTSRGTSLTQVLGWAHEVGLDYQMAFRQPGAQLVAPAVMHWKVGHFAAIVKQAYNGYRIEDPTFGETIAVSRATLDAEGSGYFVVPAGPLPAGWRAVSAAEGARIWGRGFTSSGDKNGTGVADVSALPDPCRGRLAQAAAWIGGLVRGIFGGMATANVQAMVVGLSIHDVPLNYQPAKGPGGTFELYYSHRDALQPAIFTYTNFGPKWTSNWISYLTDNTSTTGTIDLYAPGGGGESYSNNGTNFGPGVDDQAIVTRITGGFARSLPDGSMQTFTRPLGTNQFFLTSVSDPQGNKVSLSYDSHTRITSITDAAGGTTTLTYGLASDIYKVTRVIDPFGRSAVFTYNADGQLASISDSLGITSSFTYLFDSGDFISALTTPYGTDTFTYGDSTTDYKLGTIRFVTLTDPLGQTQRAEFRQGAPGIPNSDPPNTVPAGMSVLNQYLYYRDTFAWDAHQLAQAANPDGTVDYTKAAIFHFLHGGNPSQTSRTLESIKRPLENRIWFDYPGQASPINQGNTNQAMHIGRVLDDGSTQLVTAQRNNQGRLTQYTDPISRQITLTYAANGIDLLSMAQTTGGADQLLFSATYNSQHRPLSITDASGQTATFTYNSSGQVLTATNALHETTTYAYSASGLLLSVTRPLTGAVTSLNYDSSNRISTMTDSIRYKYSFAYDNGDRVTKVSYPDGTSDQFIYNLLDLATVTDRLNRSTHYTYDPLRRMTQVKDPLGRTAGFAYCDCGAVSKIADPNGNATNFIYDLEERETAKIYPDNSQTVSAYEQTTSRLKTVTDALGQATTYGYNEDDTLGSVAYSHAVNATPPVNFTWDPSFRRMTSMTDGTGKTTYVYNPITVIATLGAGRLKSITGPYGSVGYTYDALGRALTTNIAGGLSTLAFDSIGRVTSDQNPIDKFTISYLGATDWPVSIQSAHGLNTLYTYFNNAGDDRLQTITGKTQGGAAIASLQYAYDAEGEVTSAVINGQFPSTVTRTMTYDAGGQLLTLNASAGSNFAFTYDPAWNRTSQKAGSTTANFRESCRAVSHCITCPTTWEACAS